MVKGYESGFWSEGVPSGLWIPAVYKQLSLSSIIDIKKRIIGELQYARDLKRRPKTHQFYILYISYSKPYKKVMKLDIIYM